MKHIWGYGLIWGAALTVLSLLWPHHVCENGRGRGWPWAITRPPCCATLAVVLQRGPSGPISVLDPVRLLGDLALWSGLALGIQGRFQRVQLGRRECRGRV